MTRRMWKAMTALMTGLMMLCALLAMPGAVSAESGIRLHWLGSQAEDFTVTTCDGQTISLYGALAEKDMVLLHFWDAASDVCEAEMAALQEACASYGKQAEIIALSAGTEEELLTYAQRRGLTFPVARDDQGLAASFFAVVMPTSVVIDRNGVVCFIGSGALGSADAYARLFDAYVGEEYPASRLLSSVPAMRPNIPAAAPDKLDEALGVPGGALVFENPSDVYAWPMIPAEEDGRLCVMSTNRGADDMDAILYMHAEAKAGDALRITFKTSTEAASDLLVLRVNGEAVKAFGGEKDWMTYAHAFEAEGSYEIALCYEKDAMGADGSDVVFIDEAALLTGEAAAEALAANPAYPAAGAATLTLKNPDAKQILFDDPTYALLSFFGLADYYIVPGGEAQMLATLAGEADPERAFLINYYDGSQQGLVPAMSEEGYLFTTHLDSMETTGFPYTNLSLYPAADCGVMETRTIVCFASEENANAFVEQMAGYGYAVTGWQYIDGTAAGTDALPGEGVE